MSVVNLWLEVDDGTIVRVDEIKMLRPLDDEKGESGSEVFANGTWFKIVGYDVDSIIEYINQFLNLLYLKDIKQIKINTEDLRCCSECSRFSSASGTCKNDHRKHDPNDVCENWRMMTTNA